jgi:hypothetical protein
VSRPPDVEPILRAYLADTGDRAPDRVLVDVAARIADQPRRRSWRLRGRPFMNGYTKLAAGLAAVLVVGLVGWQLLPGPGGSGSQPAPDPTLAAAPTPTPTPTPTSVPTAAALSGQVQGDALAFTYVLPVGWANKTWFATKSQGPGGPAGIAVVLSGAVNVPTDPCDGVGKVSGVTTADAVLADLRARTDLTISEAASASIGGLSGLRVELQVADPAPCADRYVIFAEPDGSGIYAQGPSYRQSLWILDSRIGPIWVAIGYLPGTSAEDVAEAQSIVESIKFEP